MNVSAQAEDILKIRGLRKTSGRIALLKLLASEKKPVTAEYLKKKLRSDLDPVSLYRALEAFEKEGIVVHFDFGHGHAHYELSHDRKPHHHAVCEKCGKIEDVPALANTQLTSSALRAAPSFSAFTRHSLEFYGTCVTCAP